MTGRVSTFSVDDKTDGSSSKEEDGCRGVKRNRLSEEGVRLSGKVGDSDTNQVPTCRLSSTLVD